MAEDLELDPVGEVGHDRGDEGDDVPQEGALPLEGEQFEEGGRYLAVRDESLDDGVALDESLLAEVVTVGTGGVLGRGVFFFPFFRRLECFFVAFFSSSSA